MSIGTNLTPEPSPTEKKRGLPKLNLEVVVVSVLVAASLLMILVATFISAQNPHVYAPSKQEPLADLKPTPSPPGIDSDLDGLFDIDENYIFGTDINKVDTDGDGMPDPWEV